MKRLAALAMVMTVVSVPAWSEDAPKQTVEGAHRFLQTIAEQHGLGVEIQTSPGFYNIGTWSGLYNREQEIGGTYRMNPFDSKNVTGDACTTTFTWMYPSGAPLIDDTYGDLQHGSSRGAIATEISDLRLQTQLKVDWSRVPGVKRENDYTTRIEILGFGRLTVPTTELAARVHYAIEFLRNACDPTASTGF